MPLFKPEVLHLLESSLGWSMEQVANYLELAHCNHASRPWTEEDEQVFQTLRDHKTNSYYLSRILNRSPNLIYSKVNGLRHDKQKEKVGQKQSKGAQKLEEFIRKHFGCYTIRKEYIIHKLGEYKNFYRLDFYIPQFKLAFEYDGEQHDTFIEAWHKDKRGFEWQQRRDQRKDHIVKKFGITLLRFSWKEPLTERLFIQKSQKRET